MLEWLRSQKEKSNFLKPLIENQETYSEIVRKQVVEREGLPKINISKAIDSERSHSHKRSNIINERTENKEETNSQMINLHFKGN